MRIQTFDTTLRDGTQGEAVSFSVDDKLIIAQKLDELGIDYIEGGWPNSNPKDKEFFKRAKDVKFKHARLTAFGSTRFAKNAVDQDPNVRALLDAETPTVSLFGKSWDLHVHRALGIDERTLLVIRGCGVVGFPGSAEVVNMQPPDALCRAGITELPTLGDGRQSGTSASPSILNASPESAVGGGLALIQTGDRVRIDLKARRVDLVLSDAALAERRRALTLPKLENQTPWEEIYRSTVGQLSTGMCMELATHYHRIVEKIPRHSH